ncbi:MAG: MBL fold metallo-hydrolase [Acidobacteria bacterium]|nr:MBL fold metallo-hydrolase [Acidobacteriota bacterium]
MTEIHTIDVEFFGATELISSFLVPIDGGFVLFDPGPASGLDSLERRVGEAGYELTDLRAVFATHVHLDHAGASGVLARRTGCEVFAHPLGGPHMIDPEAKLLPSAERLYGNMMEPLWGRTVGVPEAQMRLVEDGATVTIGDLDVVGWHTPGHAKHHVAWQIDDAVSTGDVAGVRFPGASHVLPPLPPPDIDIDQWRKSLAVLRRLEPGRLLLTHFGSFDDVARHIDELEDRLVRWTAIARKTISSGGGRDELGAALERMHEEEMRSADVPPEAAERYRRLCPVKEASTGLFRYCSLENRMG